MTDTINGWPSKPGVPLNPEKDGWHWVNGMPREWVVFDDGGSWRFAGSDYRPHEWAHRIYRGPCLTPDQATALQARVAELEVETKKAKFIHQYEVKELQARATKLTRLIEILVENDPEDMAADAVTVFDVWRKEARAALEGKKDE